MLSFALSPVRAGRMLRGANVLSCRQSSVQWNRLRSGRIRACAESTSTTSEKTERLLYRDDGTRVVPVDMFIRGTADESITGVYGIMDEARQLVYVGMSRDVSKSLVNHLENQDEDLIEFIKVMTFETPDVRVMKTVAEAWKRESDDVPIGNEEGWEEADAELAEEASAIEIETGEPVISPFETEQVEVEAAAELLELSDENVDQVLNEVRPYLISDGGNVSVVSVDLDTRNVVLELQGACGSCASATTTMQMGIEKALRAKFGDNVGEITAISAADGSMGLTTEACESALDQVRDALRGLGASVEIVDIDDSEVTVSFTGPDNLKYGVELLLKDKVPGVEAVTFA